MNIIVSGRDGTGTATTTVNTLPVFNCYTVIFQNDPTSASNIKIGYTNTPALLLVPGASITLEVSNANLVHFQTTSGTATYNWSGSNN